MFCAEASESNPGPVILWNSSATSICIIECELTEFHKQLKYNALIQIAQKKKKTRKKTVLEKSTGQIALKETNNEIE